MASLKAEKAVKKKIPHTLIVLDDLADRFKPNKTSVLSNLAIRGRHYNISYIFTSQKYRFVPPAIRSNSLVKLFWHLTNQKEIDAISEENFDRQLTEAKLKDLIDTSTEGYNYLVLKAHKKTEAFIGNGLTIRSISGL
jgi:DNA helicase HerA-like ATPase